ncbi:MAG: hypothetical protein BMS9Abin02_1020 [Anaerolineae bacterium]|nr:MAG: hypothetical protein BMS9Abin02_1020 [Anaerolineae bacterium]
MINDNYWGRMSRRLATSALIVLVFASLVMFTTPAKGAVTLIYFRGTGLDRAVNLEWATGSEFNTAGFIIRRSESESGLFNDLNEIGFVPAEGDGVIGAEYSVVDNASVENEKTYWYLLVEVEANSNENSNGPVSVTAGLPTPTSTPSPTATAIAISTATPVASSTTGPDSSRAATLPVTPSAALANTAESTPLPTQPAALMPTEIEATTESEQIADASIRSISQVATATLSAAYPPPADENTGDVLEPEPAASEPASYPQPVELPLEELAYPQPEFQATRSIGEPFSPPPSGSQSGPGDSIGSNFEDRQSPDAANSQSASSTTFLWLGFIVALMIFVSGVFGSIFLFTRQRSSGE